MTDKLPDVLTEAEWMAFIEQFNEKAATGLRNKAIFTLMRAAGLRSCEVIGLKTSDVRADQLDGRPVTALRLEATKGDRERMVYLAPEAERLLQAWLDIKVGRGLGKRKHVFTTLRGGPVKSSYLREVCARKGAEAGISWRVHPHALRHTFATDLLEETGDLALTQDALGHASPQTTRVYARVRNGRLARAMVGEQEQTPEDAEEERLVGALRAFVGTLTPEQRGALAEALREG